MKTQIKNNVAHNLYSHHNIQKKLPIAIIGGGLASASLCLSLAKRKQQICIFCKDPLPATAASGNKQGALYPLLTPDNNLLSRFFQQGFIYSKQRVLELCQSGFNIDHDFCGVLQTAVNDKKQQHLNKIMAYPFWPRDMVNVVDSHQASQLAGLSINKTGLYYPQAGWVCPKDLTQASLNKAEQLTQLTQHFHCQIITIEYKNNCWYLKSTNKQYGPFKQLVLANGANITDFEQTRKLQLTPFRGQVSHIPTTPTLNKLSTVLCCDGYFTPANSGEHSMGASYVKINSAASNSINSISKSNLSYSHTEQKQNLAMLQGSYADANWINEIDISNNQAKIGVRMVSRDHFPIVGLAPNVEALYQIYKQHHQQGNKSVNQYFWNNQPIPVHQELYLLGGLGSRGICSGPLSAEVLAAMLCDEKMTDNQAIINDELISHLNPSRYWLNKLIKGREI